MLEIILNRVNIPKRDAFTLIEILVVLTITAFIALPFTNMFIFGVKGSNENTEHVIAYNLAREKIEEIKSLPFDYVKSDFDNFRQVFQDRPSYDEAFYDEDNFVKIFSDMYSDESLENSDFNETFKRLKDLYPKTYLKNLKKYPENISAFRRVVKVKRVGNSALPPTLLKVTVLVFNKKNKQIAKLSTFVGKHK